MTWLSQIRGNITSLQCASVSESVPRYVLLITAFTKLAAPRVRLGITRPPSRLSQFTARTRKSELQIDLYCNLNSPQESTWEPTILFEPTWFDQLTSWHPLNGRFFQDNPTPEKSKPIWILMKQETIGWLWHQLDHIQIIGTLLQTDNHASTSSLNILQAACYSWRPTNSVKALKALKALDTINYEKA